MFRITHNDAIELEHQVRRLYCCDRAGISGLADADHFESHPMDAAILVVAYIYAKGLQYSEIEYDEFLSKYDTIFRYPDENDAKNEIKNYIQDISEIVDKYIY